MTAADVLYLICQTQADRLGIDSAEFGGRLAGLKLWEAIRALREEYIDFFPDPTVQKSLRAVIDEKEDVLDQSWTLMASQFAQQSRQAAEDFEKSLRDLRVSPESVSTTI